MALSERQARTVLKLFVNTFASSDEDKRKEIYTDFVDSFLGGIKQWEVTIYGTFIDAGISSDIINQWQRLEEERKSTCTEEICEICKMTMEDESQIVRLLSKEIGCIPRLAKCDDIGTVKGFKTTGFSFVAKKNNEVVGLIMAQKIMDYGSYYIFVNNFAVESSMEGKDFSRRMYRKRTIRAESSGFNDEFSEDTEYSRWSV